MYAFSVSAGIVNKHGLCGQTQGSHILGDHSLLCDHGQIWFRSLCLIFLTWKLEIMPATSWNHFENVNQMIYVKCLQYHASIHPMVDVVNKRTQVSAGLPSHFRSPLIYSTIVPST